MASGQRAFAQKINKKGAAEVRKQISAAYLSDLPESVSGINLSASAVVPLDDVIEPLDYEEFLFQNQNAILRDPMRNILDFPNDDVTVHLLSRNVRTVTPVVPEHGAESDPHVRDCMKCYSKEYVKVNRNYEKFSYQHWMCEERDNTLKASMRQDYEIDLDELPTETENELENVPSQRSSLHMSETPRGSWASSIFDLRNSHADALLPKLLEREPPDEVDQANEDQRKVNRQDDLFYLYPPQSDEDLIEKREPAAVPDEHFGHLIMVKCLTLKLELEIEPIFASMALYDVKEKKRVSENFYFDLTPEPVKKLLGNHIPYQDISTMARTCIFSISNLSPDIYLVIKLEKVLQQGEISEVAEPYMKDDKNRDKVRQNAAYYCERLGKYRMPFAWTAVHLLNIINGSTTLEAEKDHGRSDSLDRRNSGMLAQYESFRNKRDSVNFVRHGSLERPKSSSLDNRGSWNLDDYLANLDNFKPVTLTVSSFFKQEIDKLSDDDLYKFLQDMRRPTSILKKLKCIPGTLKLDISPAGDEQRYCLTPDLYRVHPYPDEKSRPVKEILEFPSKEVFMPFITYKNLLYLYPKSLNFTNRQGSARNIAVKVQFMCGEEEHHALPVIFGKSSCPEYTKEAYTQVSYHSKCPNFYEEIKVKMPARLNDSHHILFTIYHISCNKKMEMTPIESPIGYTWLPLLRDGRLAVGDFVLPVSVEKPPPNYSVLHPDVQLPGMKWVDNHKGLFSISVKSTSSIHTLDEYLDRFLNLVHAAEEQKIPPRIGELNFEKELIRSIEDLIYAQNEPLVHFLHIIIDKLIQVLVRPPIIAGQLANIGQTTFETIGQVVKRMRMIGEDKCDQHGRNALLTAYIEYAGTIPHPDTSQSIPGDHLDSKMSHHSLQDYARQSKQVSPTGPVGSGYSTLGRPTSLPVTHHTRLRSTSDPDLPGSNPTSPDAEVNDIMNPGCKPVDRSGSFREQDSQSFSAHKIHSKKLVHEEVAIQWVVSTGQTRDLALANAWFFFELMAKSMAEHLAICKKFQHPRQLRFSTQFMEDITTLLNHVTRDIVEKYNKNYLATKSLNTSLAFFIKDCFPLMDRGFVFQLIKKYCKCIAHRISQLADPTSLVELRLDFLRIICSHEHYVTLNLPFGTPMTPSAPSSPCPSIESSTSATSTSTLIEKGLFTELSNDYRTQHFLAGLVLAELANVLETSNVSLQGKAICVVRNLLNSHDADPRFKDHEVRARVATLYLPLIGIVLDALPQLYDPNHDARQRSAARKEDSHGINENVAMAIASSSLYGLAGGDYDNTRKRCSILSQESTRHLLVCFLWVLKSIERPVLLAWWNELSHNMLMRILDVLYLIVANFEYKGKRAFQQYSVQTIKRSVDMKSKLEDAILGSGSARSELIARRRQQSSFFSQQQSPGHLNRPNSLEEPSSPPTPTPQSPETPSPYRLRWRKDQTTWKQSTDQPDYCRPKVDIEADAQLEGCLAAEAAMVVLDTLELIVQIVQQSYNLQSVLAYVFRVLLHGLAVNQSASVLCSMLATQRSIVSKFPELLFEEETEQCADLCLRLLRHCSSPLANIRAHSSASLYLLMRQNFEIGNNFARVKMQVTMSLSSLVGQIQNFNEEFLRKSLKTILTYAESDAELQETTFPEQVRDMVFNLHMILSDTVKMKEFHEDPEMLLDLMYRIAKGYQTSPDLRLTWLQNMAAKHSERHNHAEAAQCLVHSAGLVAEYLNMLEDKPHLPIGCVAFQEISQNVLEESAVSDDVVSPDEEGICTGKYFSEHGLVGLLEQAASSFNMAGMYEGVNSVYKALISIYEANKDFKKLASVHGKLKDAFTNIIKQEGKRVFGTYFRVGFYGMHFGDLNGEEFIYKEPAITKLAEISHRLENFYSEKFGRETVRMIKDSNTVEVDKLDPEKAYIQITYVEPFFDQYELKDRTTFFDNNYNLRRFMYATPFTMDGRAHGELPEQYKRKTVLTTTHAFPYVKTRLGVINREQVILSPIEVAIEDVQKKTKELAFALHQEPPDPKMLQMVLQGCIGTTVNQGPLEIASVFLQSILEGRESPTKHHNKLRIVFKVFLRKCHEALNRNKSLIGSDQREYQRELERNYHNVRDRLTPLIRSPAAAVVANNPSSSLSSKKKHKGSSSKRTKSYHSSNV